MDRESAVKLTKIEPGKRSVETEERLDDLPKVGQWYWVADKDDGRWLGCVVHVGSNYAEVEGIIEPQKKQQREKAWKGSTRVHLDTFDEQCTFEPNPEAYLQGRIEHHQGEVRRLMGVVHEVTARLGVGKREALPSGEETHALVVHSSGPVEDYKKALIKAKEETLPELFQHIRHENESLALWMTATTIPMKAEAEALEESLEHIGDRIFNVELYAGLTERVEQITDGKPAPEDTPLTLMQRRCYMDEESLARYEAGGMEYENIGQFDEWLARPENLDRILPHPRCVVAFRVRRDDKDRDAAGDLRAFVQLQALRDADKTTFLYLRNGERLFRLNTAIEFDEKLFPDLDRQQMTQRTYAKMWSSSRVERLLTDGEYQEIVRKWEALPAKERWHSDDPSRYEPYEPNNVHYDDITAYIGKQVAQHNRIVLILQGLLDRSPVFHPHPPWRIYTPEGFQQGLKLVFDNDRALVAGDKPDFEAYRARLNASLKAGSITVGQQDAWERAMAEKEMGRRAHDWRLRSDERHRELTHFKPYGDPGPGVVAEVAACTKTKKVTYRWERERTGRRTWRTQHLGDFVPRTFTAEASQILNVDNYQPGDFRQFFDDPRTRAEYLKWAPLLLRAEDYKAGKGPQPRGVPSQGSEESDE